uniref:Uncharacterized protein n=1 Tax=viral metagenome TaxID=1070528 RepID=A0A6C0AEF7_9ZZZZ
MLQKKRIVFFEDSENNSDLPQYLNKYTENLRCNSTSQKSVLEAIKNNENLEMPHFYNKSTFLHIMCGFNDFEMVELLISKGADVNALTLFNYTPLHYACISNNYEMVKLLVNNNADLNILNNTMRTPIFYVSIFNSSRTRNNNLSEIQELNNKLKIFKLLISKDVELNYLDREQNNILSILIYSFKLNVQQTHKNKNIFEEILKLILNNNFLRLNSINAHKIYALRFCVEFEDIELLNMLIKYGGDVNKNIDNYGDTLLCSACKLINNVDIVKLIIKHGGNIYEKNKLGMYPISLACKYGNYETIEYLSELIEGLKYDPFKESLEKKLPTKKEKKIIKEISKFEKECELFFMERLQKILDSGDYLLLDVPLEKITLKNIKNPEGDNLILMVVKNKCNLKNSTMIRIIILLLFYEVELLKVDNLGKNSLMYFIEKGNTEMINFINSYQLR